MKRGDTELIADYLNGEEDALEALFKRYFKGIYRFSYSYSKNSADAEDITQETFLKIWRNLRKFDRNRSFKTWIFSIAKNTAIDILKKKRSLVFSDFENGGENSLAKILRDAAPNPAELLESVEAADALAFAVGKLPPKYGKVLSLRYEEDLSFAEISRFLGEKLNTIKSRHHRAILMLKSIFLHQK